MAHLDLSLKIVFLAHIFNIIHYICLIRKKRQPVIFTITTVFFCVLNMMLLLKNLRNSLFPSLILLISFCGIHLR